MLEIMKKIQIAINSIFKSFCYAIMGRLKFPRNYIGQTICMEDGLKFKIFRHMKLHKNTESKKIAILIIRFKFKKMSHKANIKASKIPIPLIAGFPGFMDKIWMIDWKTNFWQGIYQWESNDTIKRYEKSFVLGIMNKRSIPESLSYRIIQNKNIEDYIESLKKRE